MIEILLVLLWSLFCVADVFAYAHARILGAEKHWWGLLPGGGFVLLHRWENSIYWKEE